MKAFDDEVRTYLSWVSKYPVLTREEEVDLFQRMEKGEAYARERLVECNLRFVVKLALAHRDHGVPLSDLIQEGNVGLLEVLDKFDWRRGFRFSTYAAFWIREAIQRAVRLQGAMIRLPVRKARLLGKMAEAVRSLRLQGIVDPTATQIAEVVDRPAEDIEEMMQLRESVLSLDQENNDEEAHSLLDSIPAPDVKSPTENLERVEMRTHVGGALTLLSQRERQVVKLRFGFHTGRSLSLRKTSRLVGLSQEGVRRVERRAITKLQRPAIRTRVAGLL